MNNLTIISITTALVLLAYAYWLYKRSHSNFFKQDREVLAEKRQLLIKLLYDFGVNTVKEKIWLEAFDAFRDHPELYSYDGATIVKDLYTINGYDAPAGNHDYRTILIDFNNVKSLLVAVYLWFKYAYLYAKDMEKVGVSSLTAWTRFVGLVVLTPFFFIHRILIKCKKSKSESI